MKSTDPDRQADDEHFCRAVLPEVSRTCALSTCALSTCALSTCALSTCALSTCALSIDALPASFGHAVRVANRLCRIVDTIEDATSLAHATRRSLFDHFDALVRDDQLVPDGLESPTWSAMSASSQGSWRRPTAWSSVTFWPQPIGRQRSGCWPCSVIGPGSTWSEPKTWRGPLGPADGH